MRGRLLPRAALAVLYLAVAVAPMAQADARFLRAATRPDFLAGTLEGIAVDNLGALRLARRSERVAELGEPFLFSIAEHPDGWVAGTGNGGHVILVRRDGGSEVLYRAEEPEIFAVWVDGRGTVYAGSSPDGKVYRIRGGEAEVFFDPEETYVWDLAPDGDGGLLVATGGEGRLYRVDRSGGSKLVYDTGDTHLRRIKRLADGDLLLGTAGEGLILRLDPETGRARTLYDSVFPEVVAFAVGDGGRCYAALLASEASQIDLARKSQEANGQEGENAGGAVSVTVAPAGGFAGSRPTDFSGSRSVILEIAPSGVAQTVWRFEEETVYAMTWRDGKLWIGTGLEGKLFSFANGEMTLEKDVDERQVVALVAEAAARSGPTFATTNGAAVYRATGEAERRGTYTSAALDAKQVSTFGSLAWRGSRPADSRVRFSVRSGMSAEPDDTWSAWSTPVAGAELALDTVPAGRFAQWRAELESGNGESPVVREVVVSYLQHNLAPQVKSLVVRPPGEVHVPANFNPGNQIFEPVSPDKSGIFTTLKAANGQESRGQKTLWKKGYRTLTWEAEDPNEDDLVYALDFRRQGDDRWLPLHEELEEETLSFDASVLPDGEYRFRLRALDRGSDSGEQPLVAERVSEPVINDHSVPTLEVIERRRDRVQVRISDAWSPLSSVEVAVDAESWRPLAPADGLLDGRGETISVELPKDAGSVLLRVMDAAFNAVTFDLSGGEDN